jgi:hypothetical protein
VELKPFRSLRYSPRVLFERGLPGLIAPPAGRLRPAAPAAENIARLVPVGAGEDSAGADLLREWLTAGILMRERRPGLWLYRQTVPREPEPLSVSMLVGIVRLEPAAAAATEPAEEQDPRSPGERIALRRRLQADFEPSLLSTRAPLSAALSTTRGPDLSARDASGVRHDAYRIHDYAQHVELQGLVKGSPVAIAEGRPLWDAARAFEADPASEKLPGAKYKLCALVEEAILQDPRITRLDVPLGFFGVSLEDPVY